MDTIFAEASPPGRGGVSLIRISGERAREVAERLAGPLPVARRAEFRIVRDGREELDRALVCRFDRGASFTGEEVVEFHLHGAPVVVRRVGEVLAAGGLRPAEAGEFTRRAFLNGRIDLAEAEGLADLLEAETEAQRQMAMRASSGELGRSVEKWRDALVQAGAMIEVSVDFADEDVPDDVPHHVIDSLHKLRAELEQELIGYPAAERLRKGFEVAIIGPPNSGKSSLLNRIAQREIALVSDVAGTTRDIIELRIDLRGMAVTMLDTAGLRVSTDRVEAMGVDRARLRAELADLRIHLSETGSADDALFCDGDLVLRGKADLADSTDLPSVSSMTGEGIEEMLTELYERLRLKAAGAGLISHERQARVLKVAAQALEQLDGLPPEILAERVRWATAALDALIGKIGAEDYLDQIFSSFCIGK